MTTVTLGTSSVTLNDTAVLSGGYHETGTITFTLYLGSTLVDTETVSATGTNGFLLAERSCAEAASQASKAPADNARNRATRTRTHTILIPAPQP